MTAPPPQPTLTDGVVTLRPWADRDVVAVVDGHDAEIALWFGQTEPPSYDGTREVLARWRAEYADGRRRVGFVVERDGDAVGAVEVRRGDGRVAALSWWLFAGRRGQGSATRAVRLLVDYAITELGALRVEAEIDPRNELSTRVATRAGLRREGLRRLVPGMHDRPDSTGALVYARLATDPPVTDPEGFRALLNSFLPRKRAISQLLVRDPDDRVLLCRLTYKADHDLPGGVVEVGESPRLAAAREVEEELGLVIAPGPLLLTDWLPPWGGWDDAVCLVFDGGIQPADVVARVVRQEREIRSVSFADPAQVRAQAADFTARRIEAALARVRGSGPAFTESGRA